MTDTPTEALPMIDCSYGKPRTYDLPGRCLTCGQRFTVRRCKGDKPPLSVDCPNCECTEYSWRDLNAILAQPAAPAEGRCLCGGPWPCPDQDAPNYRSEAYAPHGLAQPTAPAFGAAPDEGLHHHDINGEALWFEGTGGKPVGGPADD